VKKISNLTYTLKRIEYILSILKLEQKKMIGEKKLSKIRELYMKDFWFIEKN